MTKSDFMIANNKIDPDGNEQRNGPSCAEAFGKNINYIGKS